MPTVTLEREDWRTVRALLESVKTLSLERADAEFVRAWTLIFPTKLRDDVEGRQRMQLEPGELDSLIYVVSLLADAPDQGVSATDALVRVMVALDRARGPEHGPEGETIPEALEPLMARLRALPKPDDARKYLYYMKLDNLAEQAFVVCMVRLGLRTDTALATPEMIDKCSTNIVAELRDLRASEAFNPERMTPDELGRLKEGVELVAQVLALKPESGAGRENERTRARPWWRFW